MKTRNTIFTAMAFALGLALAQVVEARPRPDGGPAPVPPPPNQGIDAHSKAGAQFGMPDDILPVVSISFAPVGLTMAQTARLNLVNMDAANGITVSWRFIDANGVTLAQSVTTLALGKIVSVDYSRHADPLPRQGEPGELLRAEVRVQVDILTYGVPSESLRRSLEVFNNDTGATSVFMGGAGL
jgi:hypothetical protein